MYTTKPTPQYFLFDLLKSLTKNFSKKWQLYPLRMSTVYNSTSIFP